MLLGILLIATIVLVVVLIGAARRKREVWELEAARERGQIDDQLRTAARARAGDPMAERVRQLATLRQEGLLSEQEFQAAKQRALVMPEAAVPVKGNAMEPDRPLNELEISQLLMRKGYKVKNTGGFTWKVTEPLGGVAKLSSMAELREYAAGRVDAR